MKNQEQNWITVDREGLAALLKNKNRGWMVTELVQNAWDQNITSVHVDLAHINGDRYSLTVTDDDPQGWADISHSYTMFAPSAKKSDPTKRGRFNMGEKMLLALAERVRISSVSAAVDFSSEGRKVLGKGYYRTKGSEFKGIFNLTLGEVEEMIEVLKTLLCPAGITTTYSVHTLEVKEDRVELPVRSSLVLFKSSLPTMVEKDGQFKGVTRSTQVGLYEPLEGEKPTLYEMGIPVVELDGDMEWHIDVGQKIPLNMDRDNVTPSYLRTLRVAVLNAAHSELRDSSATWVTAASEDKRCSDEAVTAVVKDRFGDKAVAFDPSDIQANSEATAQGYNVVGGRSLTRGQWANVKGLSLILPAGKVTPSDSTVSESQNVEIPEGEWTPEMKRVAELTVSLSIAMLDLNHDIEVRFVNDNENVNKLAWFGNSTVTFNVLALGEDWFREGHGNTMLQIDLITHELAHHYSSNHLSSDYYNALTRMTGKLATRLVDPQSSLRGDLQERCGWKEVK